MTARIMANFVALPGRMVLRRFHVAGRYFREHINDETPVVVGILANAGTPLFPCKGSQRLVPSRYDHVFYRACWPNAPWQDPLSHFAS